jgi:RNA polymerase sigma factor (sigma-70 family)
MTRDELVLSHLPLAYNLALRYRRLADIEDLRSEAVIGLILAADRWDSSRGFLFSTYAKYWVAMQVNTYIHRTRAPVALSQTRASRAKQDVIGCELPLSLVDPSPRPDQIYEREERARICATLVRYCRSDRERALLEHRWLIDDEVPMSQISRRFGVSVQRVQQIESALFRRIRRGVDIETLASL